MMRAVTVRSLSAQHSFSIKGPGEKSAGPFDDHVIGLPKIHGILVEHAISVRSRGNPSSGDVSSVDRVVKTTVEARVETEISTPGVISEPENSTSAVAGLDPV